MRKIVQNIEAYGNEELFSFDNRIIMNWYPVRVLKMLESLSLKKNELTVIELGLGHGWSTALFEKLEFSSYCVLEGDPAMIAKYQNEHKDSKLDIIETYFEDFHTTEKYDAIIMGYVLEHVDNPIMLLAQYKEFLKPHGHIYITVPNSESLHRRVGQKAGLLKDTKKLSEEDIKYGHKRYYDVDLLKRHCKEAGLMVNNIEGLFLKPITTKQFLSLDLSEDVINAFCEMGVDYPELCTGLLAEVSRE